MVLQKGEDMVEKPANPSADPFQQLYEGLVAEGRAEALKRDHDPETWRYKRKPPLRFRASEAGSCPRRIYFRLAGYVPAPDSASLKLKQLEGNLAQDVVRQLWERHGVHVGGLVVEKSGAIKEILEDVVTREDSRGGTIRISARADGELDTPRGPALFEFKTISTNRLRWAQKAFDEGGHDAALAYFVKKTTYYLAQMQATMDVFERDLTYFGFKNKDTTEYGLDAGNGERTGIYVARDDAAIDQIRRTFGLVRECVEAGTPPTLDVCGRLDGCPECNFCPFYYQCYGAIKNSGKVVYPCAQ